MPVSRYVVRSLFVILLSVIFVACSSDPTDDEFERIHLTENNPPTANNRPDPDPNPDPDPDPEPEPPPPPQVILLADTNRNGVIDIDDPSEYEGRDRWTPQRGAIFLANMDDDSERCPRQGSNPDLAACYDAADDIINGPEDFLDLAPLLLLPIEELEDEDRGRLVVDEGSRPFVRLFREIDGEWLMYREEEEWLSADELRQGVEFRIEGIDVVRDTSVWDGFVQLRAEVETQVLAPEHRVDRVQMRVAPVVFPSHLDAVTEVYSAEAVVGGNMEFTTDVTRAALAANIPFPMIELETEDQWTQDHFEVGRMSMPSADGERVIEVYLRSSNIEQNFFTGQAQQRASGRIVYTYFHGSGRAGLRAIEAEGHNLDWDTLDSFGNTEVIPPYVASDGTQWTLGRLLRGQAQGYHGNPAMARFLAAQEVQRPLYIDTGWLLVAHVDETISFVPTDTRDRGWVVAVNDPALMIGIMEDLRSAGDADATMFENKFWMDWRGRQYSALTNVAETLDDPDIMAANARAAVEVDSQLEALRDEIGLSDDEIIYLPFTHQEVGGSSIAYQPGTVNGLVLGNRFVAPKTHGPYVDGVDVTRRVTEEAFAAVNVQVDWAENWDIYHRNFGEVHCGTNTLREMSPWYQSFAAQSE